MFASSPLSPQLRVNYILGILTVGEICYEIYFPGPTIMVHHTLRFCEQMKQFYLPWFPNLHCTVHN